MGEEAAAGGLAAGDRVVSAKIRGRVHYYTIHQNISHTDIQTIYLCIHLHNFSSFF